MEASQLLRGNYSVDRFQWSCAPRPAFEHELDAVEATMAACITATRYVARDDMVTNAHARRLRHVAHPAASG